MPVEGDSIIGLGVVRRWDSIDPRLDARSLGEDAIYVPAATGGIPAERLELFLELRTSLVSACGDYGTVRRGFEEVAALESRNPDDVKDLKVVGSVTFGLGGAALSITPFLANFFELRNSDDFGADISGSDNLYVIGTYDISEEEALIVEVDPLDVRYWNFAIENPWHESVDYLQRKTARTHDDVTLDADGKLRFVIAHARVDHVNYLETAGHRRGFMTFRWVGERDTKAPLPTVTKLPLAEALERARELGGR